VWERRFNTVASQTAAVYYNDIILLLMKRCLYYSTVSKLNHGHYKGGFLLIILMPLSLKRTASLLLQNIYA
jgi:hypothetical protein